MPAYNVYIKYVSNVWTKEIWSEYSCVYSFIDSFILSLTVPGKDLYLGAYKENENNKLSMTGLTHRDGNWLSQVGCVSDRPVTG